MNKDKSQMILIRISKAFKQQQQQAEIFKAWKAMQYPSLYAVIWITARIPMYTNIKEHKDSFEEAGRGLGQLISSSIIPQNRLYFCGWKMTVKTFESFLNSKILTIIPLTQLSLEYSVVTFILRSIFGFAGNLKWISFIEE
jgi:hypothetical protein